MSRVIRGLRARAALQSAKYRSPRLESLFIAAIVLWPFYLGTFPISDNSMLTHLRTGIDMVRGAGIPRTDPYSWTARGDPWVLQSWLPEWTYGWAHRIGGFQLVVLEQALLIGLLAWLVVRLARAGSPLRTALVGIVVIGIGARLWTPRPLLFGLLCMALLITVVERRRSPWLLVPIVWLWVQSHGSFPLGLLWLAARTAGEALDWRARPHESLRYLGAFLVGLAASVVNPLGIKLLTFPFTLGEKRSVFRQIIEWKSPDFQSSIGMFALVFLAVALLLLLRSRMSWRDALPTVAFVALSLLALRSIPVLAVVLAPVLGRALRRTEQPTEPASAPPPAPRSARVNRILAAAIGATYLVVTLAVFNQDPIDLSPFPRAAVTYLAGENLQRPPHHLANQDLVGNYLIFRLGRDAWDFIDDRYDMFPVRVSHAYFDLLAGGDKALGVLDRYNVDVVLWKRDRALPALLVASGKWRTRFEDKDWLLLERNR